jgi:dsRNA-specific ribonuclease
MFKVGVYLDKDLVATGEGMSKQEAQTDAAEKAIVVKNWKGKAIALIPRQKGDGV